MFNVVYAADALAHISCSHAINIQHTTLGKHVVVEPGVQRLESLVSLSAQIKVANFRATVRVT